MSRNASLYTGPAAIFDMIPVVKGMEMVKEDVCTNTECSCLNFLRINIKFCTECGSPIKRIEVEKEYIVSVNDRMDEEYNGQLMPDVLFIINSGDGFHHDFQKLATPEMQGIDSNIIVVGALSTDMVSDEQDDIDDYTTALFSYSIEEMSDMMRRFSDTYSGILQNFVEEFGPYKIVWSVNISNS